MKKDSTLRLKAHLRREVRSSFSSFPIVLETHAGFGAIYERCWSDCPLGIAIEKDRGRCEHLARQRPEWAIYSGRAELLLAAGLGAHLSVDVLDVDPYGNPWPAISGFFASKRPFAETMHVVVNDGLRNKTRMGTSWHVGTLREVVERRGNNLFPIYLETCRELLDAAIAPANYDIRRFRGYYCGHNGDMTHYWAELGRQG